MAAPSETYVDPSIAGDSGTGTSGDPYGDLQYALDTMTRDSTNGDRINILAGTDEVLTAALDLTTYGTPSITAPLIFQGYTSTAGDGGIGGISGNGSYAIYNGGTTNGIWFIDLHLHNCGSAAILTTRNNNALIGCELDNTTGNGYVFNNQLTVFFNYFHNIGARGLTGRDAFVEACHFENGTNDFTQAVYMATSSGGYVRGCVFDLDSTSDGIQFNIGSSAIGNSVFSNGGTGTGVELLASVTDSEIPIIINNICEGFSGTGGVGISAASGTEILLYGFNAFYNNATNSSLSGFIYKDLSGNDQALGSSPFIDAANDDFTVDTSVQALAYPTANYPGLSVRTYLDIGALQRQEAGAGTTAGAGGLNLGHHRLGR